MDKIFMCLHEWATPFTYNGFDKGDVVIEISETVEGVNYDIKIIKHKESNFYNQGIKLNLDGKDIKIKENTVYIKTMIKELNIYYSEKIKYSLNT